MVRYLLYVLGVVLSISALSSEAQAQSSHDHSKCGVGISNGLDIKNRMFDNRRNRANLMSLLNNGRSGPDTMYAPVQFHIVRAVDGTGGTTEQVVYNALCQLNRNFAVPTDPDFTMEFYMAGPIRTINSSLLYDDGSSATARFFMQQYKEQGVINVFIVNNTPGSGGFYRPGVADDYICMPRGNMSDDVALTHEFGHFFSLNHTFFGWEDLDYADILANTTGRTPTILPNGTAVENIARTGGTENCQISADGFCDTDPSYAFGGAGGKYNNGCVYASTAHDPYGYMFRPEYISPNPDRFKIKEGDAFPEEMWLKNLSTKDKIYPRTLIVVETEYTLGGVTTQLWQDTIGDTDTTDIYCPQNGSDNIIGTGLLDLQKGFVNFNNHYFDVKINAPTASTLSFIPAESEYMITPASNQYRVDMDSLRIENTSGTITVPANTSIVVTDEFYNGNSLISSSDRTYTLPVALAPGAVHTISAVDLRVTSNQIAGVTFGINTYAPQQTPSNTGSDNYMSYYQYIGCVQGFSPEQREAMKLDYASRGYATLFNPTPFIPITTDVTVNHPMNGAIAPQPAINFSWNAVPGATMYRVHIEEIGCAFPLSQGVVYDQVLTSTSAWITLTPNKCYEWNVYPMNPNSYSYLNADNGSFCGHTATSTTAFGSSDARFEVFDWAVGVDKVETEIESSSIYPNPSTINEEVLVAVKSLIDGTAQLSIYNSIGAEVLAAQTVDMQRGANVYGLNVSSLTAGLYIVNIKTKNRTISHKLVIQK